MTSLMSMSILAIASKVEKHRGAWAVKKIEIAVAEVWTANNILCAPKYRNGKWAQIEVTFSRR